jgi:hypothetical protein
VVLYFVVWHSNGNGNGNGRERANSYIFPELNVYVWWCGQFHYFCQFTVDEQKPPNQPNTPFNSDLISTWACTAHGPHGTPCTLHTFVVRFCYHRTIPMMRFAAYYGLHYWPQFELAAYNVLIIGRNWPRLVPV